MESCQDAAAAPMAGNQPHYCDDVHSLFKSRRTQMGMLGVIDLVASSSSPARSLAKRRVPEASVLLSTISFTLSPAPQPSLSSRAYSVFESSSASCGSDPGEVYDEGNSILSEAPPTPMSRHPGRHTMRTVGRARTESAAQWQGVLTVLMSSASRRSAC